MLEVSFIGAEKRIESNKSTANQIDLPCFLVELHISEILNIPLHIIETYDYQDIAIMLGWNQGKNLAEEMSTQTDIKNQNLKLKNNLRTT